MVKVKKRVRILGIPAPVERIERFDSIFVSYFIRGATSKTHALIYYRIIANRQPPIDASTGIKVVCENFDRKTGVITGDPNATARLAHFKSEVERVFTERCLLGEKIDARIIRDIVLGRRNHKLAIPTVIEGIRQYQQMKETQLGHGLTLLSVRRYRQYSDILERFFTITEDYGKTIDFNDLKPALEYHLFQYLKVTKAYTHNYASKIFQYQKTILEYAVAHGWADRNVLRAVRLRKERKPVVTLTMTEIRKLQSMTFDDPSATLVRDMFLMACFSGMAYVDLATLRAHHIVEVNGVKCFVKERQKSGVQAFVPVFPEAQALLDKYSRNEMCVMKGLLLPVLTNQKMNGWLKIIGHMAQIKQKLHMHLGRKSFTTYAEELGFTLNDMATMLGHTSQTMTEAFYYQRRREPVVTKFKEIFINPNADQKAV